MQEFENKLLKDLHQYLIAMGKVDERMPECPDVEDKWEQIAQSYIADGIREFADYPTVSLGWMMYLGMAVAKFWDAEWEIYSKIEDLYLYIRDKRGYDCMDEYISEDVLKLKPNESKALAKLINDCAQMGVHALQREMFEPGSPLAFHAYVCTLHQMYLMGVAVQLLRMGYKMTKI